MLIVQIKVNKERSRPLYPLHNRSLPLSVIYQLTIWYIFFYTFVYTHEYVCVHVFVFLMVDKVFK
jgi:hypothetical protein